MDLEIKRYRALPCATEIFKINGIDASTYDFGSGGDNRNACFHYDADDDIAQYGCINHVWEGQPSTPDVLEKYHITQEEYDTIVSELESTLSVGSCGWCV